MTKPTKINYPIGPIYIWRSSPFMRGWGTCYPRTMFAPLHIDYAIYCTVVKYNHLQKVKIYTMTKPLKNKIIIYLTYIWRSSPILCGQDTC